METSASSGRTAWCQRLFVKTFTQCSLRFVCCSGVVDLWPVMEDDGIEKYARQKNCPYLWSGGTVGKDVFASVKSLAAKSGLAFSASNVSTHHRLPSGCKSLKPLIAQFFQLLDTNHQVMKIGGNLKKNKELRT